MNKKTILLAAKFVATCIFFYLLGAFVQAWFDITKWGDGARLFAALLTLMYALVLVLINNDKGGQR
jgi:hypothetical protein